MSKTPGESIESYYARRAGEYERIYALPERQADLQRLRAVVADFAAGRQLLEIACGTGYWTEVAASVARAIVATDAVDDVLAVARGKGLPRERVSFARADAFDLGRLEGAFDAAMCGFWWSHVPLDRLRGFLSGLHRSLGSGGILLFDNRFVAGSSTAISRTDDGGNTYQRRALADGSVHEVIKNFPTAAEIRTVVEETGGRSVEMEELQYYWHARYVVGGAVQPA